MGQPPQYSQYPYMAGAMSPVGAGNANLVPRPKAVDVAFGLWLVVILFAAASQVISWWTSAAMMTRIMQRTGLGVQGDAHAMWFGTGLFNSTRYVGAFFGIAMLVILVFAAVYMRRGRNWGRVVLTVFGALFGLGGIFSGLMVLSLLGFTGIFAVQIVISLLGVPLAILGIVSMFLSGTDRYFARS